MDDRWKARWSNQTDSGQNKLPPSKDRWKKRSETYQGIADDGFTVGKMLPPKAKNQDLRNYSVIPIQAAMDKRLHGTAALSLLVVICTYTDQLGVTWVSQDRLAVDLGVSRTAIAKQMRRLRDLGYIVYAKKEIQVPEDNKCQSCIPNSSPGRTGSQSKPNSCITDRPGRNKTSSSPGTKGTIY